MWEGRDVRFWYDDWVKMGSLFACFLGCLGWRHKKRLSLESIMWSGGLEYHGKYLSEIGCISMS